MVDGGRIAGEVELVEVSVGGSRYFFESVLLFGKWCLRNGQHHGRACGRAVARQWVLLRIVPVFFVFPRVDVVDAEKIVDGKIIADEFGLFDVRLEVVGDVLQVQQLAEVRAGDEASQQEVKRQCGCYEFHDEFRNAKIVDKFRQNKLLEEVTLRGEAGKKKQELKLFPIRQNP